MSRNRATMASRWVASQAAIRASVVNRESRLKIEHRGNERLYLLK
jgi:hypothetical protein